jgi:hypothetical protein
MNHQALVRPSGGVTPLIHAMRIGRSHHDVAITLLGAFSRYINHLEAEDFAKPETRSLLISLRELYARIRLLFLFAYYDTRRQPQSSHRLWSPELAE